MTDYTKATGSTGTMKITDTGTVVEFWLKAGSGTYNYQLPWGYTVNGVTNNNKTFRFEQGGAWQKLSSWTVTTTQTVTFRLFDSGTSGLGGPTTLTANINRSTVPAAPSPVTLSNITSTSVFATFTDGANGGAAIDQRRIGYGTDPNASQIIVSSDGTTDITGLTPGTTYYFWAQTHNVNGWGLSSVRSQATTLKVPAAPNPPIMSNVTQVSALATWTANNNGGTPILEYQVGYDTGFTGPSVFVNSVSSPKLITGLSPATQYYFWVRARNSVGWSAWSNPFGIITVSGARVKVGGVWKNAIPYVRVDGVWVLARPWVKIMGVWKETL